MRECRACASRRSKETRGVVAGGKARVGAAAGSPSAVAWRATQAATHCLVLRPHLVPILVCALAFIGNGEWAAGPPMSPPPLPSAYLNLKLHQVVRSHLCRHKVLGRLGRRCGGSGAPAGSRQGCIGLGSQLALPVFTSRGAAPAPLDPPRHAGTSVGVGGERGLARVHSDRAIAQPNASVKGLAEGGFGGDEETSTNQKSSLTKENRSETFQPLAYLFSDPAFSSATVPAHRPPLPEATDQDGKLGPPPTFAAAPALQLPLACALHAVG